MASTTIPPTASRKPSQLLGEFESENKRPPAKSQLSEAETHDNFFDSSLGPVPSAAENSLMDSSHEDGFAIDEGDMHRQLMDVEESFVPELSNISSNQDTEVDSVSLPTLAKGERDTAPQSQQNTQRSHEEYNNQYNYQGLSSSSPSTPPEAYKTPAPHMYVKDVDDQEDDSAVGNSTSELETISSSPTAAAAARTVSRVISMATDRSYRTSNDRTPPISPLESSIPVIEETQATPRRRAATSRSRSRTVSPTPRRYNGSDEQDSIIGGLEDVAAEIGKYRTRPRVLKSRQASQRSSYSSYTTTSSMDTPSDITLGADFALQTGGAAPSGGSLVRPMMDLSRATSLGSLASGLSRLSDPNSSGLEKSLAMLDETLSDPGDITGTISNGGRGRNRTASVPGTPRTRSRDNTTPTESVIAQHVANVEVPPTFARQFYNRTKSSSPSKTSALPAPSLGRGGRHLSLKEQTNQVDRLSKENWNLKLKCTFLEQSLQKFKDKDTQELIEENTEWKMKNIELKRDNKELRKKIRTLEIQLKAIDEDVAVAENNATSEEKERLSMEEREFLYLKEQVKSYEVEIEKLKKESFARETDKMHLADLVKTLEKRRNSRDEDVAAQDETDAWRSLLESEQARREQADEDNRRLREEISRLQSEAASTAANNHTSSMYHINKPRRPSSKVSMDSGRDQDRSGATTASSATLVDQLRHENDELRREVGAQTSMLTSRNREKERLYAEIEELKLGARGNRSIAGESIWERSASRAQGRSPSRVSAVTRSTQLSDLERERYENKMDKLRDEIVQLKVERQDLLSKLDSCLDELEDVDALRKEISRMEQEADSLVSDLQAMQVERDEALKHGEDLEEQFQQYEASADEDIAALEEELDGKDQDCERLQSDLEAQKEAFTKLQGEMRSMNEGLSRLEDDAQINQKKIQVLQQELDDANKDIEAYEQNLLESNQKVERLSVQQESSQNEIAFLREEQDGDKIKIGDLESALKGTQTSLQIEKDKTKELETRLTDERHQREVVASRDKQEVQRKMNELNREISASKEESRKLQISLSSSEEELKTWKYRLEELEGGLRKVFGDPNGTRASFLTSITNLQTELQSTATELESLRRKFDEKEQLLKRRDAQLESHGLEYKRLTDVLHRERQARQADKHSFEQSLKAHQTTNRTITQKDTRIADLESLRRQDRTKLAHLELQYKDQLTERNTLLLSLWNKLSSLCGADWTHQNNLINGNLPTLDVVANMLPGFSKNLLSAVKALEASLATSKSRIRAIERDLWKDYQTLEHTLDSRIKRLDRLENLVNSSRGAVANNAEISRLRSENRMLKGEVAVLQRQPSRASSTHRTGQMSERASLMRSHSHTSAVEALEDDQPDVAAEMARLGIEGVIEPSQQRWIFRLKELEKRLKAEREARLADRSGARKRLEEGRQENEELKRQLERERVRRLVETGEIVGDENKENEKQRIQEDDRVSESEDGRRIKRSKS
ncbi:MAG: Anucleate primary sterigmata protein B [Cirrosporium novae-zelandiae]|nr:MAG: Anucleate primary sterigmata protein B [Cirrosporium novae-zelandiae]